MRCEPRVAPATTLIRSKGESASPRLLAMVVSRRSGDLRPQRSQAGIEAGDGQAIGSDDRTSEHSPDPRPGQAAGSRALEQSGHLLVQHLRRHLAHRPPSAGRSVTMSIDGDLAAIPAAWRVAFDGVVAGMAAGGSALGSARSSGYVAFGCRHVSELSDAEHLRPARRRCQGCPLVSLGRTAPPRRPPRAATPGADRGPGPTAVVSASIVTATHRAPPPPRASWRRSSTGTPSTSASDLMSRSSAGVTVASAQARAHALAI